MALGPTHEEVVTDLVRDTAPVVPAAADHALPDPDQVPQRAPAPVRHPADPRVPDEGRLQLRRRRRAAQRRATTRCTRPIAGSSTAAASPTWSSRPRAARSAATLARVHGPLPTRRGHGHPVRGVRLRGQPRAGRDRRGRVAPQPPTPAAPSRSRRSPRPQRRHDRGGLRLPEVQAATRLSKLLVYSADGKPVAVLIRGDHEANEAKIRRAFGATTLEPADPRDRSKKSTGAPMGFSGPIGLIDPDWRRPRGRRDAGDAVVGGNEVDVHLRGRRPRPRLPASSRRCADLRNAGRRRPLPPLRRAARSSATASRSATSSSSGRSTRRRWGRRFLDDTGAAAPDDHGLLRHRHEPDRGRGVEAGHDDNGIIWPLALAPYEVLLVPLQSQNPG